MHDLLQLNLRPSTAVIPAASGVRVLYVLAEITPAAVARPSRTPLHCCLVVDWSPSMRVPMADESTFRELMRRGLAKEVMLDGLPVWQLEHGLPPDIKQRVASPADWTVRAIGSAAERLSEDDQISLVAFGSQARALLTHQRGAEQGPIASTLGRLQMLDLGDQTCIASGIELGLDLLARGRSPQRADRLMLLTDGFTTDGPRCLELAGQAAAEGVPITTLGLGIEFQEDLLLALADRSGGNAAFITAPADIPPFLDRELQRSGQLLARHLRLELRLSAGVELRRLYRVRPALAELPHTIIQNRAGALSLGNLERRTPQALLLELLAPEHKRGEFRLLRSTLRADDPDGVPMEPLNAELVVDYRPDASPADDPTLTELLARINAFRLQTRALDSAASGDVAGATRQLQAAVTRLIEIGELDLASAVESEAQRLASTGQASAATTKQLRYATRRLIDQDPDGTPNGGVG